MYEYFELPASLFIRQMNVSPQMNWYSILCWAANCTVSSGLTGDQFFGARGPGRALVDGVGRVPGGVDSGRMGGENGTE